MSDDPLTAKQFAALDWPHQYTPARVGDFGRACFHRMQDGGICGGENGDSEIHQVSALLQAQNFHDAHHRDPENGDCWCCCTECNPNWDGNNPFWSAAKARREP